MVISTSKDTASIQTGMVMSRHEPLAPIALVVLWSSGFVGASLAAQSAPAETTLLWRYVVAVVPLCGWALWTRRRYGARFLAAGGSVGILAQGGYLPRRLPGGGPRRAAGYVGARGLAAAAAGGPVLWGGSGGRTDRRQALGLLTGLAGVLLVVGGDVGGAGGAPGSRRSASGSSA